TMPIQRFASPVGQASWPIGPFSAASLACTSCVGLSCIIPLLLLPILLSAAPPKPLHVVEAQLHQNEDGPPLEQGTTFVPGEAIFFSCRLDGYQVSPVKKVSISYEFAAFDPAGVPIVEPAKGKVEAELSLEDKEWKPKIRQTALVPPLAES